MRMTCCQSGTGSQPPHKAPHTPYSEAHATLSMLNVLSEDCVCQLKEGDWKCYVKDAKGGEALACLAKYFGGRPPLFLTLSWLDAETINSTGCPGCTSCVKSLAFAELC